MSKRKASNKSTERGISHASISCSRVEWYRRGELVVYTEKPLEMYDAVEEFKRDYRSQVTLEWEDTTKGFIVRIEIEPQNEEEKYHEALANAKEILMQRSNRVGWVSIDEDGWKWYYNSRFLRGEGN